MKNSFIPLSDILKAFDQISSSIGNTPLEKSLKRSALMHNNIYFKREDLQIVRSYKIRGAYYMISKAIKEKSINSIITASAGNHAQGVAWVCSQLGLRCLIIVPTNTPKQKISRIKYFGREIVEVMEYGANFDQSLKYALNLSKEYDSVLFVPPYNHQDIITGQATIAIEILSQLGEGQDIDYILVPVGGGGLIAGCINALKNMNSKAKIIAVESKGAAKLSHAIKYGPKSKLSDIDSFADGTAVKQIGAIPFSYIKDNIYDIISVEEGLIAKTMLDLYQNDGIITEPSGAISIAGLEKFIVKYPKIRNKNIVCIISGGNNDVSRYNEIIERALIYEGLKHYFIIEFSQKPGELKAFINKVLGPDDDIIYFKYIKQNNRESGKVLVGIEYSKIKDYNNMLNKIKALPLLFTEVTQDYIRGNIIL